MTAFKPDGHKRMKMSVDGDSPANASIVNYSDPFAVRTMMSSLSSGKYGSVTKDIEDLMTYQIQLLEPLFLMNPKLRKDYWDLCIRQDKNSSNVRQKPDTNFESFSVIDMSKNCNQQSALPTGQTVVIIDSDEEEESAEQKSLPFQAVLIPKPTGSNLIEDIKVSFSCNRS